MWWRRFLSLRSPALLPEEPTYLNHAVLRKWQAPAACHFSCYLLQRIRPRYHRVTTEMPPQTSPEFHQVRGQASRTPTNGLDPRLEIPALNALAVRSLGALFAEKERLFFRSLSQSPEGFHSGEISPRRTIIALLGLQRLGESGVNAPFDLPGMHEAILEDTEWVQSLGDLGLLTWFTALCKPERLRCVFNEFDFEKALKQYSDGREGQTRGLAWFLAGISHAQLTKPVVLPDLTDVAVDAFHLLQDNQGECGIFSHAAVPGFLQRSFCNRFGSFGDQIHAIYALTVFARAFHIEEPLASALNCGNAIRALQGELGQWWSVYDRRACRVASRYPVLSLHQDGTAPAGLLALSEATGQSFHEAIFKGLSWITGSNELGQDIRNMEQTLIWDSVETKRKPLKYWGAVLSFMNVPYKPDARSLQIRYEVRPDHFGWLLYAFARFGSPSKTLAAKAP